ncbi:hypothetical protein FMZ60_15250 [Alcaligenaceae bacterium SJ-26]|nr:hypothetical protein FMZ60_15250 [Alcaligenaceae bacterium SJ-26]
MTDARDTLLVIIAFLFAATACYIILVGIAFDFWLERRHRARTGQPLLTGIVAIPLLTPFHCGMVLLAPERARARSQGSTIYLAPPIWRWLAIGAVPAMILFGCTLLAAGWLLPK